jgi:hypothetical protein
MSYYPEKADYIDRLANQSFEAVDKARKTVGRAAKLQEPDYAAALVTAFPYYMNFHKVLPNAKLGGCFVHQSPKVRFLSRTAKRYEECEAGDLLVLCRRYVDGKENINATLFQIKMQDDKKKSIEHRIKSNERIQLELYQDWPIFEIKPNPTKYDIRPKAITPGAQYLCIADGLCTSMGQKRLYHSLPAKFMQLYNNYTLGEFILHFVDWQNGRPIALEGEINIDPWSAFIWELIHRTMANTFNRRDIGLTDASRTVGDFFASLLTNVNMPSLDEWADAVDFAKQYSYEENDGISILLIDEIQKKLAD